MKNYKLLYVILILISSNCLGKTYREDSSLYYGNRSDNFVIRWAYQDLCDHVYDKRTDIWPTHKDGVTVDPEKVKKGDIIFVRDVTRFLKKVHPFITQPYIMVTAGEFHDRTQSSHEAVLNEETIIKWFSVHPSFYWPSEKFEPLPLGILQSNDFYVERKKWGEKFDQLRKAQKEHLLYVNFKKKENLEGFSYENREEVFQLFENKRYSLTMVKRRPFKKYLEEMAFCKFALSPPGLGPDCYRTWESLLVGTIPIVQSGPTDVLYKDLPVLIVDDWNDVTEELLERTWDEFTLKKFNIEKLFVECWKAKIYKTRDEYLSAEEQKIYEESLKVVEENEYVEEVDPKVYEKAVLVSEKLSSVKSGESSPSLLGKIVAFIQNGWHRIVD